MTTVDQGQAHALLIPLADSAVLPLFGVTFQTAAEVRPRQCGQADMWNARAIVTRDEAFLSLVVWSLEGGVRIRQAENFRLVRRMIAESAEQW